MKHLLIYFIITRLLLLTGLFVSSGSLQHMFRDIRENFMLFICFILLPIPDLALPLMYISNLDNSRSDINRFFKRTFVKIFKKKPQIKMCTIKDMEEL